MKLPERIFGKNKLRDAIICQLFVEGYDPNEIKAMRRLSISIRQIQRIVYNNREVVTVNREWENLQQVRRIKRQIKKAKQSKRDVLDWEALLSDKMDTKKVEFSGDVKGGDTKIIIIRADEQKQIPENRIAQIEIERPVES
jgi:hypothetical protein